MSKSLLSLLLFTCIFFTGCSSSPDSEEIQELLEKQLKVELDNHHKARNAFSSALSGSFGQAPASGNPSSDSLVLSNLQVVDEKINENLFGKEIRVYSVKLDANYDVNGVARREEGQEGYVSLIDTDDGWNVAQFSFSNFLGFRNLN